MGQCWPEVTWWCNRNHQLHGQGCVELVRFTGYCNILYSNYFCVSLFPAQLDAIFKAYYENWLNVLIPVKSTLSLILISIDIFVCSFLYPIAYKTTSMYHDVCFMSVVWIVIYLYLFAQCIWFTRVAAINGVGKPGSVITSEHIRIISQEPVKCT